MTNIQKISVNEPFELLPGQFEVIKELAQIEGQPLAEWIRWCVIKMAECDMEDGIEISKSICEKLKKKWGPDSTNWPEEADTS